MSVSSAESVKLLRLKAGHNEKSSVRNMHKAYVCNHGRVHGAVQVIVCVSFSSYYSSTHYCRMEKAQSLLIPCHHPQLPQCNWSRDVNPLSPTALLML